MEFITQFKIKKNKLILLKTIIFLLYLTNSTKAFEQSKDNKWSVVCNGEAIVQIYPLLKIESRTFKFIINDNSKEIEQINEINLPSSVHGNEDAVLQLGGRDIFTFQYRFPNLFIDGKINRRTGEFTFGQIKGKIKSDFTYDKLKKDGTYGKCEGDECDDSTFRSYTGKCKN